MAKEMVVLQGKTFSIDLQSMLGSTNYGWALTCLPQGIALLRTELSWVNPRIGPTIQRFWFGAVSVTKDKEEIEFTMLKLSDMTPTDKKLSVLVKVIPSDSEEFVKLNEKGESMFADVFNAIPPYGFPSPKEVQDSIVNVKYGYPCGDNPYIIKYGYPCGVQDTVNVKYGYPCGDNPINPVIGKYGYPCGTQDAVNVKYGYPCGDNSIIVKYGYPCGVQDAVNVKYGYPCDSQENVNVKYGYPCGVQDATKTQNAAVMYGFKCDNLNSQD